MKNRYTCPAVPEYDSNRRGLVPKPGFALALFLAGLVVFLLGNDRELQARDNAEITWSGPGAAWNTVDTSWTWQSGPTPFQSGDSAIFAGASPVSINVDPAGVLIAAMQISGSNYLFSGGAIVSTPTSTLPAGQVTQKLLLDGGDAIFANDATFANGAEISSGRTLQIGNGANSGSFTGNIVNNGTLIFFRDTLEGDRFADPFIISNAISGSGTIRFSGTGASSQFAYSGNAAHTIFNGNVIVENGARLQLTGSSQGVGNGIVVQDGGTLWLETNTIYNNAISIQGNGWLEGGTIQIGALRLGNNTRANGQITLAGNARIGLINATSTISGAIGDGGSGYALEKTENGTLILSGSNTYSGGTTIAEGVLSVSRDDNLGAASGVLNIGSLSDAGTLLVTETFSTGRAISLVNATQNTIEVAEGKTLTVTSLFSGANTLTKLGSGTLTLSAANTFTGAANVNAGTLIVANSLGLQQAAVQVNGGILQAAQDTTFRSVAINSGRAEVAHNWTITDGLMVGSGGFLVIAAGGTPGTPTPTFPTIITPTATIAGTLLPDLRAILPLAAGTVFTVPILSTNSGGLTLDPAASLAGRRPFYNYAFIELASDALSLRIGAQGTFSEFATSPNTASLAGALDLARSLNIPITGELFSALAAIFVSATPEEVAFQLQNLSPSVLAGGTALSLAARHFRDSLAGFLRRRWLENPESRQTAAAARGDAYAQLAGAGRDAWQFWAEGLGAWSRADSGNPDPGYDATQWGGTLAAFRSSGNLTFGGAFAMNHARMDWEGGFGKTSGNSYAGALFASFERDGWFAMLDGMYGGTEVKSSRTIRSLGLTASAEYWARWYGADLYAGHRFDLGGWRVAPGVGVRWYRFETPDVAEVGAGNAGLTMAGDLQTGVEAFGRVDVSRTFAGNGVVWRPRAFFGVAVETADTRMTPIMNFAGGGGMPSFLGYAPETGRVAGQVGLGLDVELNDRVTLYGEYQAELRDRYQRHSGTIGIGVEF